MRTGCANLKCGFKVSQSQSEQREITIYINGNNISIATADTGLQTRLAQCTLPIDKISASAETHVIDKGIGATVKEMVGLKITYLLKGVV